MAINRQTRRPRSLQPPVQSSSGCARSTLRLASCHTLKTHRAANAGLFLPSPCLQLRSSQSYAMRPEIAWLCYLGLRVAGGQEEAARTLTAVRVGR